jgi:predicted CopG family antitoxin
MTATITIKDDRGRYKELQKQFADDRHLSNYISYMYKKGWHVVGVELNK